MEDMEDKFLVHNSETGEHGYVTIPPEVVWADRDCYDEGYPNRIIVASAVMFRGVLFLGMRHSHCLRKASEHFGSVRVGTGDKNGFVDNFMQFLTREEALILAEGNGQLKRRTGRGNELFSEDLW